MRAEPRTYSVTGDPRVMFGGPAHGMFIECEITDPPSSAGRNIEVYLSAEMVDKLLRELRRSAAMRRATPMGANR